MKPLDTLRDAIISDCGNYRYLLSRSWDPALPALLIIGLNPSTADALQNDPTIRRCIGFAKSLGFGSLYVANLFAFRHPDPNTLFAQADPVGPENDRYIRKYIQKASKVVVAWGNCGNRLGRDKTVLKLIDEAWCLKINKSGQPAHPLYLKKNLKLKPYPNNGNSGQY